MPATRWAYRKSIGEQHTFILPVGGGASLLDLALLEVGDGGCWLKNLGEIEKVCVARAAPRREIVLANQGSGGFEFSVKGISA
jgi:hypothetical protein